MPPRRDEDYNTRVARERRREQEARRLRGEISCAECRRLKMKCDKKVPCSTCSRRGCQAICPNGTGSRLVLASSKLHGKLLELAERIRQLEDALAVSHAAQSASLHPLLAGELLEIKFGIDVPEETGVSQEKTTEGRDREEGYDTDPNIDLNQAFETLTLSEGGAERFLGLLSGSRSLTNPPPDPPLHDTQFFAMLPPDLAHFAKAWPFPPVSSSASQVRALIEAQLPSWERANAICESFLMYLGCFYRPIDREQLMEELLPAVYRRVRVGPGAEARVGSPASTVATDGAATQTGGVQPEHVPGSWRGFGPAYAEGGNGSLPSPTSTALAYSSELGSDASHAQPPTQEDMHELALLLIVLATGAVGDLSRAPYNPEAELYAQLSRAALAAQPISDGATLATVQALALMGVYTIFSTRKASYEPSWMLFGVAYSAAASIGLHRDPARWKLDPKIINRRRLIFWELATMNNWQSLSSGRPALFCMHSNDVAFPEDDGATEDKNGVTIPGYWRWRYRFTKEVLGPVNERVTVASSMKYSDVLALDRSLRDFHLEQFRRPQINIASSVAEEMKILQHTSSTNHMDVVTMCIHRNFFAKTVLDHSSDPLHSPYAPSFLAAFRSATAILKSVREHVAARGSQLLRLWPVWTHSLSAAVIIASIVTRCPSCALAPTAFVELGLAVSLFEQAAMHAVVREGLPILLRLRDNAQQAMNEQRTKVGAAEAPPTEVMDEHRFEQTMSTLQERWRVAPQPAAAHSSSCASSPRTILTPAHAQRCQNSQGDLDLLVRAQIPQAVLDTSSASTFPTTSHGLFPKLVRDAHPEITSRAERNFPCHSADTPSVYPSSQANSAPATPPVAGPSWQARSPQPTATSSAEVNSRAKGVSSVFKYADFSEPSAFVRSAPPDQSELGLESVSRQPGLPAYAPDPGRGFEALENDDANMMQMPLDAAMDDAWTVFVHDSGFNDPGIFDMGC